MPSSTKRQTLIVNRIKGNTSLLVLLLLLQELAFS